MHLANRIEYTIKKARKRIAVSLKIASEKASCENWRVPFFEYYNIDLSTLKLFQKYAPIFVIPSETQDWNH